MPSKPQTQKEALLLLGLKIDTLTESNKKIAKDQFQLSCDFSTYINKNDLRYSEILGYLESNEKTNQKGLVEQVKVNTNDINTIKVDRKIDKTKVGVIGGIVGTIAAFIAKFIF